MASLIVVTGPPGAGKSSVASVISERSPGSVLIQGDAFFGFLGQDAILPWLPEAHDQNEVVVSASAAAAGRFVTGGMTTIFDGMIGPWFLPRFVEETGLDQLQYAILFPSVERCVERVATRVGHGFTDEPATRRMYDAFAGAPIPDRHLIRDTDHGPEAVAAELRSRLDRGDLLYEP
jgi:hypothetical protein